MAEDLYARGVGRLMVEGGRHDPHPVPDRATSPTSCTSWWRRSSSATPRARRFVSDGAFPWNPDRRATLAEVRQIGDVVLLRYALSARFGTGTV